MKKCLIFLRFITNCIYQQFMANKTVMTIIAYNSKINTKHKLDIDEVELNLTVRLSLFKMSLH